MYHQFLFADWFPSSTDEAGSGGVSKSGTAVGGNGKRGFPSPVIPKPGNGGSAKTGNSGNVNGGSVENIGHNIINGYGASKSSFSSAMWWFTYHSLSQMRPVTVDSPEVVMPSEDRALSLAATVASPSQETLAMLMVDPSSTRAAISSTVQTPVGPSRYSPFHLTDVVRRPRWQWWYF